MGSQLALLTAGIAALALLWWRLSLSTRAKITGLANELTTLTATIETSAARAAKLRRALDAAKIVVWEVDPATPAVKRSPLSCSPERGGCPIAFVAPDADLSAVHPDDHEALLAQRQAVQQHPSARAEFRIVGPNGTVSHLLSLARRTDSTTVGLNIDITPMREGELARAAHRERIRRASEAAMDCFYEIELLTGKLWVARPYHVDILGYPPSKEPSDPTINAANLIHHPDDHQMMNEAVWQHLNGRTPLFEFEYRIRAYSGEWVWLSNKGAAIRNEAGQALRLSGVTRDISEKKAFQRTLIQAREAAAAANHAKSEFLANMSHEIRTPMNGVLGMTDLLLDTQLDGVQRDYAETIRSSGKALLAVINDVLDFSKLEAGKLDLEIIDVDLRETLTALIDQLAPQAQAKGLELTLQIDPALPEMVRGDPGRIQQIVLNLTHNGIKFTDHGSVAIDLRVLERNAEGVRLRCEARDTGMGIPNERLGSLFEPFSQLDTSSTRKHGGAGLGLCIVRRLVELMGGEAGVESREGAGSCFWFTVQLPVAAPRKRLRPMAPHRAIHPGEAREQRILIADDNPVNRKVTLRLLEKLGCRADCVANGKDAIAAWESGRYHLILMDCQMPDMDGFQATREIRRMEVGTEHIPIVALTAETGSTIEAACAAAGMDATLAKPLEREVLEDALGRYLRQSAPTRPDEGS